MKVKVVLDLVVLIGCLLNNARGGKPESARALPKGQTLNVWNGHEPIRGYRLQRRGTTGRSTQAAAIHRPYSACFDCLYEHQCKRQIDLFGSGVRHRPGHRAVVCAAVRTRNSAHVEEQK